MKIKINPKYSEKEVGFNGSAKPLGKREDLLILAEKALRSNNPELLKLFDELPTLKEIQDYKGEQFLAKTAQVPIIQAPPNEVKVEEPPLEQTVIVEKKANK